MITEKDPGSDHKALVILVSALIFGVLMFSGISVVLYYSGQEHSRLGKYSKIVFGGGVTIAAILVVTLRTIYSNRMDKLRESNAPPSEKIEKFRGILIAHMACCEFIGLAGVIAFILLGDFWLFLIVAIAVMEMVKKIPSQEKFDAVTNSGF